MLPRSRSDRALVALLFYASLVAEIVAWLAFAMAIVIVVSLLNPKLAHGGPVEDRWPHEIAAPSRFDAADFLNMWAAADDGVVVGVADVSPPPRPPSPVPTSPSPSPPKDRAIICASAPDKSTVHWMWREIDGRRCWYVGTTLVDKSLLRWPRAPVRVVRADPIPATNTYAEHGGGRVRRIGHFPYGTAECCW